MKILHTSDLHIGKRIYELSMIEEQKRALREIIRIADEMQVDAIIIAGDVYDKSIPSAESVSLLDDFLAELMNLQKPVFIISGNHDSAERLSFGSRIMSARRLYLSPVYDGVVEPIILPDGNREVAFYMLPFVKPSVLQPFAEEGARIGSFDEAVRFAISRMDIDRRRTNILITHQFITDSCRSESEDEPVGGLDNVDASAFEAFDYVALGHLHRPQWCDSNKRIRYSGTPLKYSFSEINDKKSVSIVETDEKGGISVREVPLASGREWYDLRGEYDELTAKSFYDGKGYQDGYVRITLTDEDDIPDGMRRLKAIYPYLLELRYDNMRTRLSQEEIGSPVALKSPLALFSELFEKQNGQPMSAEQESHIISLINDIFSSH